MTKEQEEAIEILEGMIKSYIEADECGLSNNDFKHEIRAMQTVLNMLKEKDKLYHKALVDLVKADRENIQLKKQTDLMAEEINETDRGYTDYCEMKIECDRNCKDCIKRYYERKSEKWKLKLKNMFELKMERLIRL